MSDVHIETRDFVPTDLHFILKSWLRSYWNCMRKEYCEALYYPAQERLIRDIMQSAGARVLIACEHGNTDFILGFIVTELLTTLEPDEPLIVHYMFTKLSYRKCGVGRYLLESAGWQPGRTIHATHRNYWLGKSRDKYSIVQNPYILHGYKAQTRHVQYGDTLADYYKPGTGASPSR